MSRFFARGFGFLYGFMVSGFQFPVKALLCCRVQAFIKMTFKWSTGTFAGAAFHPLWVAETDVAIPKSEEERQNT